MKILLGPPGEGRVFWGEIAPRDHLVQIYDDEGVFLDRLSGFVAGGLEAGDAVVVIASQAHRKAVDEKLESAGLDVAAARAQDQYVALDAQETLAQFMVNQWPDEQRFQQTVSTLLARAGAHGRRVRAFGEMVALLWAQGQCGATVRLEYLWHRLCEQEGFSLLCAYPKSGFTVDAADSIRQICDAHSHVVEGNGLLTRRHSPFGHLAPTIHGVD